MPVRAKICGLTRPEDAAAAVAAGASYLGVVLAGGPRRVTVTRAAEIASVGGSVPVIGVYGDQSVEEILRINEEAGLSGAQLHGPYPRAAAAELRSRRLQVWRVVRIAEPGDLDALEAAALDADAVLVEPRVPHAAGGTGVGEAVALVRPEVVDVGSGVESLPGKKDPEKIARFMEAVFGHSAIS